MESQSFWSKSYVHTLLTIVLVAAIAALGAYAYYTLKQSEGVYTGATTINVQGEGEVQVKPDLGMFSFSVMAEGKDLLQVLWSGADVLRGKMDANEYKTYLLGLVFYKYLSDS